LKYDAHLFEGLTIRRVLVVTAISAPPRRRRVALPQHLSRSARERPVRRLHEHGSLHRRRKHRQDRVPREVMQVLAIIAGSFIGTILAGWSRAAT